MSKGGQWLDGFCSVVYPCWDASGVRSKVRGEVRTGIDVR